MKVVFVHPSHPSQFTRLARELDGRDGWECACLVLEGFAQAVRAENPSIAYYGFREEAPATGLPYYLQSLEEGTRRGKAALEALAHLRAAGEVDLAVGHASFGVTFFARELLGVPVVSYVELPGYFPVHARPDFPAQYPQALMDACLRALIHGSVLGSDLCVVPSEHARSLFPPELRAKVRVRMEGFDLPDPIPDRSALRSALGLGGEGPVVGFAGRTLEAVRGFDTFVRAAEAIRRRRPDARFLVLGDEGTLYGNETAYLEGVSFKRHALESAGADPGGYVFRPCQPHADFVRHLQAMDLVLFPLYEGAANWGLFEALAAGVPVLASRRCFVPEAIADGRDGLLFEPGDSEGFARAALRLLADPVERARLGANGRKRVGRDFSVARAVEGYAAILREAVEVHAGDRNGLEARDGGRTGLRRRTPRARGNGAGAGTGRNGFKVEPSARGG